MTLKEWELSARVSSSVHAPSGCVYVVVGFDNPRRVDLFRLCDYVVSSVVGPVLWLVRRRPAVD